MAKKSKKRGSRGVKRKKRSSKKKKKTSKKSKKYSKKRRSNTNAAKQMRWLHREAKRHGLTYSEYMRRRRERQNAVFARRAQMSQEEVFRDMIKSGQLFGAEDIAEAAGMTPAEVRAADDATLRRDRAALEQRAAQGDKQSQATLARITAMGG